MSDYFATNTVESLIAVGLLYLLIYRFAFYSLSKSLGWKVTRYIYFSCLILAVYSVLSLSAHKSNESTPWLEIVGVSVGVWVLAHALLYLLKPNFSATVTDSKFPHFGKNHDYQKVLSVDPSLISTYPRLSIYDLGTKEMIFDSTDFEMIRQSLGISDDHQPGFAVECDFKLLGEDFVTKRMNVDYLNIFDDFSELQTKVRSGKKIPYNIQIIIYAEKKRTGTPKATRPLNTLWIDKFLASDRWKSTRFKQLADISYPPFEIDGNLVDVVDLETFNKIENDRLPLFVQNEMGSYPMNENLSGFFNGKKKLAVLGKSAKTGVVTGLKIYAVNQECKRADDAILLNYIHNEIGTTS